MRIGILADIHEDLDNLRWALSALRGRGVDRLVVLGDVFDTGHRMAETVAMLDCDDIVGVWGNHDIGLCADYPGPGDRERYGGRTLDFMGRLEPRLRIEDCLFTHVEPWLDPEKIEDLWNAGGEPDTAEKLALSFGAVPDRVLFVGHFHRWLLATPQGPLAWEVGEPMVLDAGGRYFVIVNAVLGGYRALFDTGTRLLEPIDVRKETMG